MLSKRIKKRVHRKQGFSLVLVVITASITSIFLLASAANIIPMYKTIGTAITDVQLLSAAQSATDLTIGLLNDSNSRPNFDSPHTYGAFSKVNDNYALIPSMFGLPDGATIEVWVRNVAPMKSAVGSFAEPTRSRSFDPLLSPTNDPGLPAELNNTGERWGLYSGAGKNGWRVIETRVRYGVMQKLLLTTLKPVLEAGGPVDTGGTPLFSNSDHSVGNAKGLNSFSLGNNSKTSSFSQTTEYTASSGESIVGDVASFGKISLFGNAEIGGKAQLMQDSYSVNSGAISADTSGATINQFLQSDGRYSDSTLTTSNVLNKGDNSKGGDFADGGSDPLNGLSVAFSGVAPAPSAPGGTDSFPSLSVESGATTVTGGDRVIPGVNIGTGSSLNVGAGGPLRLFVEGSHSDSSVVKIYGNVNSVGDASNFQIYYNGSGSIDIQGAIINAVIYAPNANVSINSSTFSGAITARNVAGAYNADGTVQKGVENSRIRLDYDTRDLGSTTSSAAAKGLNYDLNDILNPARFKVVSVLEPRNPNDLKYAH